ncbi:MAG: S41 family peptidase [Pseudomonadota bacterium]
MRSPIALRRIISSVLVLCVCSLLSCGGDSGSGRSPSADTSAFDVFDEVWSDFDRNYSFFTLKGIDWQGLGDAYRAQLTVGSSDLEAYQVISALLLELQDAHVELSTPFGTSRYTGWYDVYPDNFDKGIISASYLGGSERLSPQAGFTYGLVAPGVAYVHIGSLAGSGFDDDLELVLEELGPVLGLVIDLRHNGGGSDQNGEALMGRLTRTSTVYRRVRFRDGPLHDDFGPFIESSTSPNPPQLYDGPVAVLVNRRTASSAESLVLALRTLPTVRVIGDYTAGASANPASRTARNGWRYTVSRWVEYQPDGTTFEGIGLAPDKLVSITPMDAALMRDTILDEALTDLRGRNK